MLGTGDREGQEQEVSGQDEQIWVISLSLLLKMWELDGGGQQDKIILEGLL